MNKYLVKLLPLGKFFFGGDMTFKVNKETAFSSYIIHSFTTPQQTSILGMMRFLILSNNDEVFDVKANKIREKAKADADALIGEKGFSVSKDHKERDYRAILRIGPCFVLDTKKQMPYFKASRDTDLQIEKSNRVDATVNGRHFKIPDIYFKAKEETRHFTGKDNLSHYYRSLDGKELKKETELFIEDTHIGINKNYSGKTESEAFYKQISYRLEKDLCFAFEVEVADCIDLTAYNKQIVKLGADDSSFVFEAECVNKVEYPVLKEDLMIVLLSDTYLPDLPDCKLLFAITEVRPFRFLSMTNSENAQDYNVKYISSRSTERYDLYQAGSVFYFNNKSDKEEFCKFIDSYMEFKQIGYNQYY